MANETAKLTEAQERCLAAAFWAIFELSEAVRARREAEAREADARGREEAA